MAEPKTRPTDADPYAFVAGVANPTRRADAEQLIDLVSHVTGQEPVMWGPSIVGFGRYDYPAGQGIREWPAIGFSPRAAATTIYFVDGFETRGAQLDQLGPHSIGRGCLYVKRLADVDLGVLEQMIGESYTAVTTGTFPPR